MTSWGGATGVEQLYEREEQGRDTEPETGQTVQLKILTLKQVKQYKHWDMDLK
jgi:hypothetical protein